MQTRSMLIAHIEGNDDHAKLVSTIADGASIPCRIIRFTDAENAIDYLHGELQSFHRDQYPIPDLILLELDLPGMSGLTFLRRIRAHKKTREVPIVVLTGSTNEHEISAAYRYGANSYIVKPDNTEDFVIKLTELNMYWSLTSEVPRGISTVVSY